MDDAGGPLTAIVSPRDYVREETLDRIRHFLLRPRNSAYTDLKGMCDRVSDSYRDRVVLELLQNAHDAHNRKRVDGRIRILFDPDDGPFGTLSVANDGDGFTPDNFDALSSPSRTTKGVSEAIGNKGVGFLSVFQVSAHPEIYSRKTADGAGFDGFCFRFADDLTVQRFLTEAGIGDQAEQVISGMPRLYLTFPVDDVPPAVAVLAVEGFATVVRLPLKSKEAQDSVAAQLDQLGTGPPVQLFLTRIAELAIQRLGSSPTLLNLPRRTELLHSAGDMRLLKVTCGTQAFVVAQRVVVEEQMLAVITDDVEAGRLPDAWLEWKGEAVVSLAVTAMGAPLSGRLYNFLPMGSKAAAPFAGHLDAPFHASINRLDLQTGVHLNSLLWKTARMLAIDSARAIQRLLSGLEARTSVLDLLLWRGDEKKLILEVVAGDEPLAPVLRRGAKTWAGFDKVRVWKGDEVMTPQLVARVTNLAIIDPDIGPERLTALTTFLEGRYVVACGPSERGDAAEAIASEMHDRKRPTARWDAFYTSLAQLFRSDPASLAGRNLLLTARGELAPTAGGEARAKRGARRKRLSAVFLPPLRGATDVAALPRAVNRRLDYVNANLEMAREGANAARRFLLSANLVRDHESREILRLLAAAMHEPGEVKDPDGLRWEALTAMMRIVTAEDTADGVVVELPTLVPARTGWIRASTAYFSSRWAGEASLGLDRLFDDAAGLSTELDAHAGRRLVPFADWKVKAGDRDAWVKFLRKSGVVDHLRPVPAFAGTAPRELAYLLAPALVRRAGLPTGQTAAWERRMQATSALPNPNTIYTVSGAMRLPGQLDHAILAPVVGRIFALQLIRTLEVHPDLSRMSVFRPSDHHQFAQNRVDWCSPIGAFISEAAWLPLADGSLAELSRAWLPGSAPTMPPRLPVVDHAVVSALIRHPAAGEALRVAGLGTFGAATQAWRFLDAAAQIVTAGLTPPEGERMLSAARDAWLQADLASAPAALRLIGRQRGSVAATALAEAGPPVLVADGDDRQMVAATVRATPDTAVFEPPRAKASEIGAFLRQRFPTRITRVAGLAVTYESGGAAIAFSPDDPFIEDVLGAGLRDVLILSLRYKNSFYRGDLEGVLQRLAAVRIRWLPDLSMRIGDHVEPVPRFTDRAVLIQHPDGATVLAARALQGSARRLGAMAEALGAAVGSRRQIGEPLLAFAAQLQPDPLDCTEADYAEVLEASVEEIRGVLGSSRAALAGALRTLRPIVTLSKGVDAAVTFAPGGGLASDDDVLRALEALQPGLPAPAADLLQRARQGDVRSIALGLDLNLADLNAVLAALGAPYATIDLGPAHQETLSTFLGRKEGSIRESIRAAYRSVFESRGDLSDYVAARDASRPILPAGFGLRSISLSQTTMTEWLAEWLLGLGVPSLVQAATGRDASDTVLEANLRRIRALAPTIRVAVLRKAAADDALRSTFATLASTESALTGATTKGGWGDFERLYDDSILAWLARTGLWPGGWQTTLDALGLVDEDFLAITQQDERNRIEAATRRRTIEFSGGTFTVGVDSLGSLADRIAGLVATNATLLATSTRLTKGEAPVIRHSPPDQSGERPGNPPWLPPSTRLSEEERDVIGFFGEAIAFDWLKKRFSGKRVIDLSCWKSGYRRHVADGYGNDGLGYDFEVRNGGTTWYFEVKATKTETLQSRHMIELGSSEIAHAEVCRADKRSRFRILYVLNALHPEKARLFVLPNPRSRDGETFYAEPMGAGVRLLFAPPS